MKNGTAPLGRDSGHEDASSNDAILVQCSGFRCLAFRDRLGKWRDYFHHGELKGEVMAVESDPALMAVALEILEAGNN